jgi:hypothetical protein
MNGRVLGVFTGVLLLAGAGVGAAHFTAPRTAAVEATMITAANDFVASLDAAGRDKAVRPFDDDARFEWFFTPVERSGLPLEEMTLEQRTAALALLRSGTSSQGFQKASGVMRLEEILGGLENRPDRRDPENYHVWVFGTPGSDSPWGWRFEGHHVSMSFTSVGGLSLSTPTFIGSNPARVPSGPHAGWRLLAHEEDLARELVLSLDPGQRSRAVISDTAPSDILTGNSREARIGQTQGLPVSALTPAQRALFLRLLGEYVDNAEPAIARARYARMEEVGMEQVHFAWAGSLEPGGPHYYRIHGPTVLIEYDNTQNDANHIHSVWRDLENDFGGDVLRMHYQRAGSEHGHGAEG